MTITLQKQPTDMSCGQTCVAMIVGIPARDILLKRPDKKNGTTVQDLIKLLRGYGFRTDYELTLGPPLTKTAICRMKIPRKSVGHWIVYHEGLFFDPAEPCIHDGGLHIPGYRLTSHLMIGGRT